MCEHSHHITHHKPKEENTKKKFLGRVLGPDGSPHHISPSHIREHKEEVLGPSSWAGWLTTPHLTITHHKPKEENTKKKFLGRVLGPDGILDTITHHKPKEENTKKKFLGRVLGPDGSPHHISPSHIREHKEEVLGPSSRAGWLTTPHLTITHHKPKEENTKKKFLGRVLGPDGILTTSHIITSHHIRHHKPKRQKSTSFLVKTSFKSIAEHRKVRELPRKMNIEEVEEPKKYENLQTKPVLDPFKSTADHLKVRELARKTNIEEVEEPETTKIYRQNPLTPAAATRKLREFTDETNMQARK